MSVSDACNSVIGIANAFVQVGGYSPLQMNTSPNGSDTICQGEFIELIAVAGGGVPPYTYTWNQGLGTGNNFFVGPTSTTIYNVVVTDGCLSLPDSKTITVNVGDFQNPSFSADKEEGCIPHLVNFSPDSLVPGYSYSWDFGDASVITDNSAQVPHAYPEVGCYSVTLTVTTDLGCVTNLTKPCFIKTRPNPVAAFVF